MKALLLAGAAAIVAGLVYFRLRPAGVPQSVMPPNPGAPPLAGRPLYQGGAPASVMPLSAAGGSPTPFAMVAGGAAYPSPAGLPGDAGPGFVGGFFRSGSATYVDPSGQTITVDLAMSPPRLRPGIIDTEA